MNVSDKNSLVGKFVSIHWANLVVELESAWTQFTMRVFTARRVACAVLVWDSILGLGHGQGTMHGGSDVSTGNSTTFHKLTTPALVEADSFIHSHCVLKHTTRPIPNSDVASSERNPADAAVTDRR